MIDVTAFDLRNARRDYDQFVKWFDGRIESPNIGSMTRNLFQLLGTCDPTNVRKLAVVFPAETYVFLEFSESLDLIRCGFNVLDV